jgi:hypothetical protein
MRRLQEAEDIVAQSFRGIRSGSRVWDPEKEPDFAIFAGMVVVSNAKHWRVEAFNRRRDRGAFDETAQRRVAGVGASPRANRHPQAGVHARVRDGLSQGQPRRPALRSDQRGINHPADQAKALGVTVEQIRQLVARVHAVCNRIIQEGSKS